MGITRTTRTQIGAEAVDWFLQLQEPAAAETDRDSFSEWLLRSPAHVEEYLRVACAWSLANVGAEGNLGAAALVAAAREHHEKDNVVPLPGRFGQHPRRRRAESVPGLHSRMWRPALVASLMVGIVLWAAYLTGYSSTTIQTMVGEQRSFSLQDGSIVFLNTDSLVRVEWSPTQRHIELVRGEARFKVAKDAHRPFIVATATAGVRAVGTIFNVRAEPRSTQVAVLEGQVEVSVAPSGAPQAVALAASRNESAAAPSQALARIRLAAGERADVSSHGIQTNTGPPIEAVVAWTERRLVFRDQPLSSVIHEFNRYRTYPLVLDDPGLGGMRISGVFDLSDTESLIAYLGTFEVVQVTRKSDGSQHLFRGSAAVDSRK